MQIEHQTLNSESRISNSVQMYNIKLCEYRIQLQNSEGLISNFELVTYEVVQQLKKILAEHLILILMLILVVDNRISTFLSSEQLNFFFICFVIYGKKCKI